MGNRQRDLNTAPTQCHVSVPKATLENRHRDSPVPQEKRGSKVRLKELSTRYSVDNIGDRGRSAAM